MPKVYRTAATALAVLLFVAAPATAGDRAETQVEVADAYWRAVAAHDYSGAYDRLSRERQLVELEVIAGAAHGFHEAHAPIEERDGVPDLDALRAVCADHNLRITDDRHDFIAGALALDGVARRVLHAALHRWCTDSDLSMWDDLPADIDAATDALRFVLEGGAWRIN